MFTDIIDGIVPFSIPQFFTRAGQYHPASPLAKPDANKSSRPPVTVVSGRIPPGDDHAQTTYAPFGRSGPSCSPPGPRRPDHVSHYQRQSFARDEPPITSDVVRKNPGVRPCGVAELGGLVGLAEIVLYLAGTSLNIASMSLHTTEVLTRRKRHCIRLSCYSTRLKHRRIRCAPEAFLTLSLQALYLRAAFLLLKCRLQYSRSLETAAKWPPNGLPTH